MTRTFKITTPPSIFRLAFAAASLLFALASQMTLAQDAPTDFRVIPLSAGIHLIKAEVAATYAEREQGLMFRTALGQNQGMIFLFDDDNVQCMWMKNTLVALSVAFIDADNEIINIEDMQPQTETSHCAKRPSRYALEMNLGWFAKRGLKAGSKISGLPKPRY